MDRKAAAAQLDCSEQKIYKVEQGIGGLKAVEVDDLLELYGADDEASERVRAIATTARRRGSYGKVPDWSRQYFGLEQDATEIASYRGELIPGLMQTETYARVLVSTSKMVAPADVDEVVRARVRRQRLLERPDPPLVHVILGEAAVYRAASMPGGAEQLDHLIHLAEQKHVTMQAMSFRTGLHAALDVPFTLLTLTVGDDTARWVYLSDLTRGECRADESQVRAYQMTWDSLAVNAENERETLKLLKRSRDAINE